MSDNTLLTKSKELAKNIITASKHIRDTFKDNIMSNQLLRCGTSVGANIHEAQYAQSTADFISKLEIALKECYECEYWLDILFETDYIEKDRYDKLKYDCGRIRKMLISSCTTMKKT